MGEEKKFYQVSSFFAKKDPSSEYFNIPLCVGCLDNPRYEGECPHYFDDKGRVQLKGENPAWVAVCSQGPRMALVKKPQKQTGA